MSTIYCNICYQNYNRTTWYRHIQTRKHIDNQDQQNRIEEQERNKQERERQVRHNEFERQERDKQHHKYKSVIQELQRRNLLKLYYEAEHPKNLSVPLIPSKLEKEIAKIKSKHEPHTYDKLLIRTKLEKEIAKIKSKHKPHTYDKLLSTIFYQGERKIRNTTEVFPDQNLFNLPDIRVETRDDPATREVILHFIDDNLTNGIENYFNTLRFTIRNQIRKYYQNGLMIKVRLVCTFDTNREGFIERIITYPVRIRVEDLDGIDRFTNHLSDLFGEALDRFQGPGDPSGTKLVSINA